MLSEAILPEQRTVFLQPGFCDFIRGAGGFDLAPEVAGVVQFAQMTELVKDDVILDVHWRLDEAPVQRDGGPTRARAPTGFLVAHGDAAHGKLVELREFENAWGKFLGGQSPEMFFNRGTKVGGVRRFDDFVAEEDGSVCAGFDLQRFAAKEDFSADEPFFGLIGTGGEALELAREPIGLAFGKAAGFGGGATAGNGDTRGAIRAQSEDVTAGAEIADEGHRDLTVVHLQKRICRWAPERIQDELELHAAIKA